MPHFTIEYSGNLDGRVDMGAVVELVRKAAVETGRPVVPIHIEGSRRLLRTGWHLQHPGRITLKRMIALLSVNPARLLNVRGGSLDEGAPADLTVLAPDLAVTIDAARLVSKSKNTPFDHWKFRGGVAATIVGGKVVYRNAIVH